MSFLKTLFGRGSRPKLSQSQPASQPIASPDPKQPAGGEHSPVAEASDRLPQLQCPTCGTNYRLGDDAAMVTSQDITNVFQRGGATIIGTDGAISGEVWTPVATQTRPALIGRKRNREHPTEADLLQDKADLLENVRRIRTTIEKGNKAFWYCEKCRNNQKPHAFPRDF